MTTGSAAAMGVIIIEPRPGPLPFSAIDRYAHRFGIDGPSEFEFFLDQLQRLDREYLSWEAERAKERAAARS